MTIIATAKIPPELIEQKRWVCHKGKRPIDPATGKAASSTDPGTWGTYQQALETWHRLGCHGVGFVLGDGWAGIDIDHCLDPDTGEINGDALYILDTMQSYTERSPSGTGIHILWRGKKPGGACRGEIAPGVGLEMYDGGRYFTVTGQSWHEPLLQVQERSEQAAAVYARYLEKPRTAGEGIEPFAGSGGFSSALMDDDEILFRARTAKNGDKFAALWAGNCSGYASRSEADQALCNMLAFWFGRDKARMDKAFRRSKLYRQKWDERHGADTYGSMTLDKAIADCLEVYAPGRWPYKPKDFSDAGNAAAFADWTQAPGNEQHRLLHCPALGWLHWTGAVWEIAKHEAIAAVEQYTQEMLDDAKWAFADAKSEDDIKKAQKYLQFVKSSRSNRAIKAMLDLAEPRLHEDLAAFDADPEKLNCPGGLVDLRTGKMQPHDPAQRCTKICSVNPAGDQQGRDLWLKFLDQITQNDAELINYLQQIAGMAAVGKVLTEKAVFLIGNGRNGKSTWANALAAVFGTYAATMQIEALTTVRQQRGAVYAELQGKRLVQTGELEQGSRLSVSTLKQLCSTDKIPCERKYCAPGEFTPSHTLIVCSNYKPRVGSDDDGCWRRIAVVPFNAEFEGVDEVKNYAAHLVDQAGGAILQWAVDGAGEYLDHEGVLPESERVETATKEYRDQEDWLNNFLAERCERNPAGRIRPAELYDAYVGWARKSGDYVRRVQDFTAGMKQRSFVQCKIHGNYYWAGLKLSDDILYSEFA